MGDVAKGIKSFKKGLAEEEEAPAAATPPATMATQKVADQAHAEVKSPAGTETKA